MYKKNKYPALKQLIFNIKALLLQKPQLYISTPNSCFNRYPTKNEPNKE
jgi:hypothetical protein